MAHFDKAELLDFIRHSVSLEDDSYTGEGQLIAKVKKRAKYGGLPLNFRSQASDDETIDEEGFYELPSEPSSTKALINERLTCRTSDMTQAAIRNTVLQSISPLTSFPATIQPLEPGCNKNDVTSLLKIQKSPLLAELSDYEQYEGSSSRPSKRILILVAPDGRADEASARVLVTIQSSALLRHLIGYAMFKYVQKTGIELPGKVSEYSLYVADETGEIDTDLPPLDNQTQLARLGFNVLALVRTQHSNSPKRRHIVHAYTTDHACYSIEVPSLQTATIKWLLDEVVRIIDEEDDERERTSGIKLLRIREYTVERVDELNQPFELTQSIASCGVTDFLIVQKNSSRGDFIPSQPGFSRQLSTNSLSLARLPSLSPLEYINGETLTPLASPSSRLDATSTFLHDDDDQLVASFLVKKVQRFKPNWKAHFIIRYSGFDVTPVLETDQVSTLISQSRHRQRQKSVPWQYVAHFAVEKSTSTEKKAQIDTWYLTFWYVPSLNRQQLSSMIDEELSPLDVKKLYKEVDWKCLKLQMCSREEVEEAARHCEALLLLHYDGAIPKVFAFSKNGTIHPTAAAKQLLIKENHRSVRSPPETNGSVFGKLTSSLKRKFT